MYPLVSVENISFRYRDISLFESFSYYAYEGDVVHIFGRNGAGKTTLLKIVSGYIRPTQGRVTINGFDVHEVPHLLRARLVSFAQQLPFYISPIGVYEFISFGLYTHSWKSLEKVFYFSKLMGITELLYKPLSILSEGQKKLVLLTRVFVQDSNVILLDEPDAFLDLENQDILADVISMLSCQGKIFFIVSHNLGFISRIKGRLRKLEIFRKEESFMSNIRG